MNCYECGRPASHSHHVVPRSLGGTRTVTLCTDCHAAAHGKAGDPWRSTAELTRLALAAKKARGERAGTVPYGYTADLRGRLRVAPSEQSVISRVLTLRASGVSLRGIVSRLAESGHVSRSGRPLTVTQVARLARSATPRRPRWQQLSLLAGEP